jgi:CheY-like chemotaxis protein
MISKHTILYAEDDLDDLMMVRQAFEPHDHIEVLHAANGIEALEHLQNLQNEDTQPCLVILDINMPKMDGRETLEQMKNNEALRNIPVVLFSTSSSRQDKQFAEKWGVELITKPLHYSDLEHIAKVFIDRCNFELKKLS